MFRDYPKANIIRPAAALVIALANWSPLWAKAPATQGAEVTNGDGVATMLRPSPAVPSDLQVSMMDEMEMMKKKGAMGAGRMPGNMPSDDSMSNTDSGGVQDPMAAPSGGDAMGRVRGSMPGERGMSAIAPIGRLPGFPGASHLYHVGATGFFLDHPQHITLSTEQQRALNRIKERALLDRSNANRRIEDAEQELWTLTAADAPDAIKIDASVRAIEKLRGDQRIGFIGAVGEAGKVLTPDQQAALLGTKPPAGGKPSAQRTPPPTSNPAAMPRM